MKNQENKAQLGEGRGSSSGDERERLGELQQNRKSMQKNKFNNINNDYNRNDNDNSNNTIQRATAIATTRARTKSVTTPTSSMRTNN